MTAKEFLAWALDGEYDLEDALRALGSYIDAKESYFLEFPDADVTDETGSPLAESTNEPAGFREYWEEWQEPGKPGRPFLPPNERRKIRSIKMTDAEWEELKRRAARRGVSAAEYIREKTLG